MKALLITICLFLLAIDAYSKDAYSCKTGMSGKSIQEIETCIDEIDEALKILNFAIKNDVNLEYNLNSKNLLEKYRDEIVAFIKHKKKEEKCAEKSASAKSEFSARKIFVICMGR